MKGKIVVLVENNALHKGLSAEHGLSLYVETDRGNILFDTGQSDLLLKNAKTLGIDLTKINKIVLSHGHYDHTGGLLPLLKTLKKKIEVIAHPDAFKKIHFGCGWIGIGRDIGIPFEESDLRKYAELIEDDKPREVLPGIFTTGEIERRTDYEDAGEGFFLDQNCRKPDIIRDDQALILDADEGLIVLFGCGHSGLINTLIKVREMFQNREIRAVMGGFHLGGALEERLEKTCEALPEFGVKEIYPGHCTGWRAINRFSLRKDWITSPLFVGFQYEF
jgi:7,8-dihydropterin-6-yl-methyl-4-(beta-D-ribofuranosyl)aminobenzene 5'-phosphate synthase